MDGDLDTLLRRLHEVGSELDRLGDDQSERRYELRALQDELRAQAKAIRDSVPDNPSELRRRLEGLYGERDALEGMRISPVKRHSGSDERKRRRGFSADAEKLNQAIDEATGRAELDERIRALEVRLAQLEPW